MWKTKTLTNMTPKQLFENASIDTLSNEIQEKVRSAKETHRGLYIHGKVGVGKTYMMHAIKNYFTKTYNRAWFENYTEMVATIKNESLSNYGFSETLDKLKKYEYPVFIDDITTERVTDFQEEIMYRILDSRYDSGYITYLSSNRDTDAITNVFGSRITSRILGMCDKMEIKGKDLRMKEALDKTK